MRRLTDSERLRAEASYPEAVRLCRRMGVRLGLTPDQCDSAASLAAIDAGRGHDLDYRAWFRCRSEKSPKRSLSWRGKPDPGPLQHDPPSPARDEDDGHLVSALQSLSPRQWESVDLAILGGLGPARAAKVMGVAKQSTALYLKNALAKLRAAMADVA